MQNSISRSVRNHVIVGTDKRQCVAASVVAAAQSVADDFRTGNNRLSFISTPPGFGMQSALRKTLGAAGFSIADLRLDLADHHEVENFFERYPASPETVVIVSADDVDGKGSDLRVLAMLRYVDAQGRIVVIGRNVRG